MAGLSRVSADSCTWDWHLECLRELDALRTHDPMGWQMLGALVEKSKTPGGLSRREHRFPMKSATHPIGELTPVADVDPDPDAELVRLYFGEAPEAETQVAGLKTASKPASYGPTGENADAVKAIQNGHIAEAERRFCAHYAIS